jgi:Activator of Hsp90 ATPase homolog 1-like protein
VLEATPAAVYAALTTPQGLRGWWTQDGDTATAVGSTIHFRFGRNHEDMRIERLESGREVRFAPCGCAHRRRRHCTKGRVGGHAARLPPFAGQESGTRLDFEHRGLGPAFACYELCSSNGWRHYLGSLRQFVETGRATRCELAATEAT